MQKRRRPSKKMKKHRWKVSIFDDNKISVSSSSSVSIYFRCFFFTPPSDLLETFKRLLRNKVYFFNNCSAIFYVLGYVPIFMYQSKYMQVHFLLSPSDANSLTGMVTIVCAALGLLSAGIVCIIDKKIYNTNNPLLNSHHCRWLQYLNHRQDTWQDGMLSQVQYQPLA